MNFRTSDQRRLIFVFGSNEAGRHGAGAALQAMRTWGAQYGHGVGRQGDAYAIPTKSARFQVLSLERIQVYVNQFFEYARANQLEKFAVTPIGCGLAGYKQWHIAPLFKDAPLNCDLPFGWRSFSRSTDQSPECFALLYRQELSEGVYRDELRYRMPSPAQQKILESFEIVHVPRPLGDDETKEPQS